MMEKLWLEIASVVTAPSTTIVIHPLIGVGTLLAGLGIAARFGIGAVTHYLTFRSNVKVNVAAVGDADANFREIRAVLGNILAQLVSNQTKLVELIEQLTRQNQH